MALAVGLPPAYKWWQLGAEATFQAVIGDLWIGVLLAIFLFVIGIAWAAPKIHAEQERIGASLKDKLNKHEDDFRFKSIGPSPVGKPGEWEIVLIDGTYAVALHCDAYGYYLGQPEDGKRRIRDYIKGERRPQFGLGDVLLATDTRKFARAMLDRFIGEGNSLCERIRSAGVAEGQATSVDT